VKNITLLIVEDEEAIRDMLCFSLQNKNFNILNADNTEEAIQILSHTIPDLMILDWMLPGKSGIEFIKWIRQEKVLKNIPIIMLTAKVEEENKIKGLMVGADDYITKPFSIDELIARIITILRRGVLISPENEIKIGDMVLNIDKYNLTIKKQQVKLLPGEYKLLHFFITHPNKTYTRDQLIDYIYGRNCYIDDRTIDVQIKRLRERLRPYNCDGFIKTIRGVGYCFLREEHEKRY